MRVLLDTHAFIWWLLDAPRLSNAAKDVLGDGSNEVWLSSVSAYEIAVKVSQGRLELPEPVDTYIPSRVAGEGFLQLALYVGHATKAGSLPPIHKDPFDRLLIAQAQLEDLPILTVDPVIGRYDVETIW